MIFVEFMAEMKKPHTFWKAALAAQTFIFLCYLLYGLIIYHAQGQYSYIIPTLSIANQKMLIASNVFGIVTVQVATVLYGNIGIKVFYFNVLQAYFKFPELTSKAGGRAWVVLVFIYYTIAVSPFGLPKKKSTLTAFSFCAVHHRFGHSQCLLAGRLGRCRLHSSIHLHLPSDSVVRLHGPSRCLGRRGRMAPRHGHQLKQNRYLEGLFAMEARFPKEFCGQDAPHLHFPVLYGALRSRCLCRSRRYQIDIPNRWPRTLVLMQGSWPACLGWLSAQRLIAMVYMLDGCLSLAEKGEKCTFRSFRP